MVQKKNSVLSIKQKKEIIKYHEENPKKPYTQVADKYSIDFKIPVTRRMVDYSIQNKENIEKYPVENEFNAKISKNNQNTST